VSQILFLLRVKRLLLVSRTRALVGIFLIQASHALYRSLASLKWVSSLTSLTYTAGSPLAPSRHVSTLIPTKCPWEKCSRSHPAFAVCFQNLSRNLAVETILKLRAGLAASRMLSEIRSRMDDPKSGLLGPQECRYELVTEREVAM